MSLAARGKSSPLTDRYQTIASIKPGKGTDCSLTARKFLEKSNVDVTFVLALE